MYRLLCLLMCVTLVCNLQGQAWFDVQTDLFDAGHSFSGTPVAVVDMNNDFLDDVVYLDQGVQLNIAYQQFHTEQFKVSGLGRVGKDPQWSLVVFDLDRNGLRDIIIAGAYDDVKIYYQETDSFRLVKHPIPDIYAQAMNGVDINGDGWTDLFLCNDIGYNQVWWNEQGILRRDTMNLFSDLPPAVSSGNYGSEWVDIEGDGDMDLYIAKCNAAATDPTDLRRVNRLYIQQDNGTFTEEAGVRNVASGAQSWTGHFSDLNNDGFPDLLVTNHDQRAEIFHNDGTGFFEDKTNRSSTRIVGPVIQSMAIDIDLDQKKDLVIGGVPDYLYRQRSNDQFSQESQELGYYNLTSLATGDLNHDNRPDLFATVGMLINLPSQMRDRILLNQIKEAFGHGVWLIGTESNPEGIGAVISVFSGDEIQVKHVKSGESYGIQNSYLHLFGALSSSGNVIDSIQVKWPSGNIQVLTKLSGSVKSVFIEGTDILSLNNGWKKTYGEICDGDSILLVMPPNADSISVAGQWVQDDVWVKEAGLYGLEACYEGKGCFTLPGYLVQKDEAPSGRIQVTDGNTLGCQGETVTLAVESLDATNIEWADGNTDNPRLITDPGNYVPVLKGQCLDTSLDTIRVRWIDPVLTMVEGDTVRKGDTARISAIAPNGTVRWYAQERDSVILSSKDTFEIPAVQKDTSFYVAGHLQVERPSSFVGLDTLQGSGLYHSDDLNGTMIFEVHRKVLFEATSVYTTIAGERAIVLLDKDLKNIGTWNVDLDTGWTRIPLNIELDPNDRPFRITTDSDINQGSFGTRSPKLASSDSNILYPYSKEGLLTIITSQYGNGSYDYFYKWEVRGVDILCESTRQRVEVIIKNTTFLTDLKDQYIHIWPNPSSGIVAIEIPRDMEELVEWYSLQGRRIFPNRIDLDERGDKIIARYRFLVTGVKMLKVGKKTWPVLVRK